MSYAMSRVCDRVATNSLGEVCVTNRELVRVAVLFVLALTALVWLAWPERCGWRPERGFEWEAGELTRECIYEHPHARDPEELCQLKAASRGLVRWRCE